MSQLAEDPLIDRLKELGMDFVAEVLEGKVRPTRQQSDMLARGYADPVPREAGTVVVGGCADGRRIEAPDEMERIVISALPGRARLAGPWHELRPTGYDRYHAMRLVADLTIIKVFVLDGMDDGESLSRLVNCYGRSLTDTME